MIVSSLHLHSPSAAVLFGRLQSTWLCLASQQKSCNQRSKLLRSQWVLPHNWKPQSSRFKNPVFHPQAHQLDHILLCPLLYFHLYRGEGSKGCWSERSGIGLKLHFSQMEPRLFPPVSLQSKEGHQIALLHAPFLLLDGGSAVWCLGDTSKDCGMYGNTAEQGTRIKPVFS